MSQALPRMGLSGGGVRGTALSLALLSFTFFNLCHFNLFYGMRSDGRVRWAGSWDSMPFMRRPLGLPQAQGVENDAGKEGGESQEVTLRCQGSGGPVRAKWVSGRGGGRVEAKTSEGFRRVSGREGTAAAPLLGSTL